MMQKKKFKNYNPKLKEECGVFGISNIDDASAVTALGLHALQLEDKKDVELLLLMGKSTTQKNVLD